jgi:hypothetical protein
MVALPYALLDRICELGATLDETTAAAISELLRHAANANGAAAAVRHARMLLRGDALGMFDILVDTWRLAAAPTSGGEIGAALMAACVQSRRQQH